MTLRELLSEGTTLLRNAQLENPDTDAWLLLAHVYDCNRTDLLVRGQEPLTEDERIIRYREWIGRRAEHVPVQYIIGRAPFMGLEFEVTPAVLIPRFDTEILVEEAIKELQRSSQTGLPGIIDVCTGSGCIAVSIAHQIPCRMTAVDLSRDALQIAERNACALLTPEQRTGDRFTLIHSDMFDCVEGTYDYILSNPPYIPPSVIKTLAPEVREKEPMMALDGGEDGLDFYRILAREGASHLVPGGKILLEIGYDQGEAVLHLLYENHFTDGRVVKDLAGLDRVVVATRA